LTCERQISGLIQIKWEQVFMDIFLQQTANGLTIGSIFALVALGYTMVYGVMKLINFAHGDMVAASDSSA